MLIADPADSASGRQAAALLEQLGIALQVRPKLSLGTGNNPLSAVGFGDAELALHGIVEIMQAPSVKLVGSVPDALQQWTRYDVAIVEEAPNAGDARRLVEFLKGPAARTIWQRRGVEAVPPS